MNKYVFGEYIESKQGMLLFFDVYRCDATDEEKKGASAVQHTNCH